MAAPARSLEMENARLRAEIATQYAIEAARAMAAEGAPQQTAPLSASQRSQGRSGQLGSEVTHYPVTLLMQSRLFCDSYVEFCLECNPTLSWWLAFLPTCFSPM